MDNLKFPFMNNLKLELYGNVPEPHQQPHTLGGQAMGLKREIGFLVKKLVCQQSPKITPELIGIIRSLTDEMGKISLKLNGWKAAQPKEHHLRKLQVFPTLLFKELWKHLGEEVTQPTRRPTCRKPPLPPVPQPTAQSTTQPTKAVDMLYSVRREVKADSPRLSDHNTIARKEKKPSVCCTPYPVPTPASQLGYPS